MQKAPRARVKLQGQPKKVFSLLGVKPLALLTLYPNHELRARFPSPSPAPRTSGPSPLKLVNRLKVAISDADALEACRYPSCPWPRPGYGGSPKPTPFSLYARRMLARAGGCFAPPAEGRLVFLTGTLPGSTEAALKAISDHSAWVVHELLTRLPRVIASKASDLLWEWVWEFQSRGALHWHGVVECKTADDAKVLMGAFRGVWSSVLQGLAKRSGVDVFERSYGGSWRDEPEKWRIDAQLAYASPQQYLSKYLDKDASKAGSAAGYYPTRWYGCSRRLLFELKAATVVRSTRQGSRVADWLISTADVDLLQWIQSLSTKTIAFVDKVGTGSTVVFYLRDGENSVIRKFVRGLKSVIELFRDEWEGLASGQRRVEHRIRWRCIDMCGVSSFLRERLYSDIGERQRALLESYVLGQEVDSVELRIIDNYARTLLVNAGFFAHVNSEAPPVRGVDIDAPKDAGRSGGCQVEINYPGLPF
jgi:hypothetical protein